MLLYCFGLEFKFLVNITEVKVENRIEYNRMELCTILSSLYNYRSFINKKPCEL